VHFLVQRCRTLEEVKCFSVINLSHNHCRIVLHPGTYRPELVNLVNTVIQISGETFLETINVPTSSTGDSLGLLPFAPHVLYHSQYVLSPRPVSWIPIWGWHLSEEFFDKRANCTF